MADKRPGLLKRIFSFGFGSKKAAPPPETETSHEQVAPPPETAPRPKPVFEPEPASRPEPTRKQELVPRPEPEQPVAEKPEPPATKQPKPSSSARKPVGATAPAPKKLPEASKPSRKKFEKPARQEAPPVVEREPEEVPAPQPTAEAAAENESATGQGRREETGGGARPSSLKAQPEPHAATPGSQLRREGWFQRLRKGLARSSDALVGNVAAIFTKRRLDEATLQELEDVLIQADLGIETAMAITDALSARRLGREVTDREIRQVMADEIARVLAPVARPLELDLTTRPHVILVVGVNGSGKTTTIGKLSAKLRGAGYSTMLVAGDTFRAAAIEQLAIWGERTRSPVVARQLGADAAGLAFDAYHQAVEEGHDVLIMDTAGRLQNKKELMAELEKIVRVLKKQDPDAPQTVLLTLDATTGQNALSQVEIFKDVAGVNGLVMTKLDGTARGGILVAIASKFGLPVYFVGVGEQVEDLEPFEADEFANSIVGLEPEAATMEAG
jgi:fused signal recognition particle receptor